MLTKLLYSSILIFFTLAPLGVVQAADVPVDCRLKGGSVVQLPAEACKLEGGTPASAAATAVPETVETGGQPTLTDAQKAIIGILAKPVETKSASKKNLEGIERTARFDGCRLIVDEKLYIEYGNLFSASMEFKINAVFDLQNINRGEFGVLGKVTSKGGSLSGTAVSFEEPKKKSGNRVSISVLYLRKGDYKKYTSHGSSAYWDAPRDDFWIADEYGYVKETGMGYGATDKVRIFLIVSSPDDAVALKDALDEVNAMCKTQPTEPINQQGQ